MIEMKMALDDKLSSEKKIDLISVGVGLVVGLGLLYSFYTDVYRREDGLPKYSIVEDSKKLDKVPWHTIWQP